MTTKKKPVRRWVKWILENKTICQDVDRRWLRRQTTPLSAWRNADERQLRWAFTESEAPHVIGLANTCWCAMSADKIRKKWPKPPARVLKALVHQ